MDTPQIIDLAKQVTTAVAPFLPVLEPILTGAGEKIGGVAAGAGLDRAKALWAKLSAAVQGNGDARKAAQEVAQAPDDEDAVAALRLQIRKLLAANPSLARDLAGVLGGDGRVVASGEGSVAIGGNVSGSTIVTGRGNRVGR